MEVTVCLTVTVDGGFWRIHLMLIDWQDNFEKNKGEQFVIKRIFTNYQIIISADHLQPLVTDNCNHLRQQKHLKLLPKG